MKKKTCGKNTSLEYWQIGFEYSQCHFEINPDWFPIILLVNKNVSSYRIFIMVNKDKSRRSWTDGSGKDAMIKEKI